VKAAPVGLSKTLSAPGRKHACKAAAVTLPKTLSAPGRGRAWKAVRSASAASGRRSRLPSMSACAVAAVARKKGRTSPVPRARSTARCALRSAPAKFLRGPGQGQGKWRDAAPELTGAGGGRKAGGGAQGARRRRAHRLSFHRMSADASSFSTSRSASFCGCGSAASSSSSPGAPASCSVARGPITSHH